MSVALLALGLASRTGHWTAADDRKGPSVQRAPGVVFVYAAIAFSGLTALGAEVVWTRLLSLLLGAPPSRLCYMADSRTQESTVEPKEMK